MSQPNAESRIRTGTPAYQSHRPATALLIASKRPLTKPSPVPRTINPSVNPASVTIKPSLSSTTTATVTGTTDGRSKAHTVEVDLSQPPQPFLDPGVWERMQATRRDASTGPRAEREQGEDERRRRREREAEFGQMAVRGRIGGLGRQRR